MPPASGHHQLSGIALRGRIYELRHKGLTTNQVIVQDNAQTEICRLGPGEYVHLATSDTGWEARITEYRSFPLKTIVLLTDDNRRNILSKNVGKLHIVKNVSEPPKRLKLQLPVIADVEEGWYVWVRRDTPENSKKAVGLYAHGELDRADDVLQSMYNGMAYLVHPAKDGASWVITPYTQDDDPTKEDT